jgi:hypothetical protein
MTRRNHLFVVDRIEGRTAVLVPDEGNALDVQVGRLPAGTREGSVLRVPSGRAGGPDWAAAVLDEEERRRRLEEAEAILEELEKRDPGGDVTL